MVILLLHQLLIVGIVNMLICFHTITYSHHYANHISQ